jgi:hypothetical protein
MKQAYKHRPQDFKRKILSRLYSNKNNLLKEEYKWLKQIKQEELKKRYYNLHNHKFNHWSTNTNVEEIKNKLKTNGKERWQKISATLTGRKNGPLSNEHKKKISEALSKSPKKVGIKLSDYHKQRLSESHKGIKQSEETKRKRAERQTGREPWNKGKKMPDSMRQKLSQYYALKKSAA